ncbi:hypothetical protein [Saccharopolyspora pogona]|uniref:hypothetical protein n=1 Tax=Saccharopolyspora pogona TaxID=333966 RepID=UPI00168511BB|nr:hypothetical protein [Saccharopolyspora pogona]
MLHPVDQVALPRSAMVAKPVSAACIASRSRVTECPARVATSVSVVRPRSGRPRSAASTAPEM